MSSLISYFDDMWSKISHEKIWDPVTLITSTRDASASKKTFHCPMLSVVWCGVLWSLTRWNHHHQLHHLHHHHSGIMLGDFLKEMENEDPPLTDRNQGFPSERAFSPKNRLYFAPLSPSKNMVILENGK